MAKQIAYNQDARERIRSGVRQLARAVKVTFGPAGHTVIVHKSFGGPSVTKDGVSVAKEIELADAFENMGAKLVIEVAKKTADSAGDGTTSATILAEAIFSEGLRYLATGVNPAALKRGIDRSVDAVVEHLQSLSKKVRTDEIQHVATIAASLPAEAIAAAARSTAPLPGRLEPVAGGAPFPVLVDFAHTPDGLRTVIEALATLGAIIYFYPVALPRSQLFGVLVSVIGVLANASASILGRDVNRAGDVHPLVVTVISMGIGSIALLATGIAVQGLPKISIEGWAIIAWLAVVNTAFAFTLWNHTLRTLSATESSIINGTMLIWIPVLAVLFLHERVTAKEVFGLAVVGVGMLIVQLRQPRIVTRLLRRQSV